jgi:RNA polymerase subunit RPABC4/transcription elongation factor Spt4
MQNKINDDVREFITAAIDGVELEGLCPICKTRRSQNGECWHGHIVIDVSKSATVKALRAGAAQQYVQRTRNCTAPLTQTVGRLRPGE